MVQMLGRVGKYENFINYCIHLSQFVKNGKLHVKRFYQLEAFSGSKNVRGPHGIYFGEIFCNIYESFSNILLWQLHMEIPDNSD